MYAGAGALSSTATKEAGGPLISGYIFALASPGDLVALTRRQREIYDFICSFIREKGYSPSLEEIGEAFKLSSVATVHKHIGQLVEKGWLKKAWNRSRSLEPTRPEASAEAELPLLGVVAAGAPIEAIEQRETISVPVELARGGSRFVLRVRGDSMIEDQICDGDYVVVEQRAEARDGETVVALLGGSDATLKTFYRDGATVRLVPANRHLQPIVVPAEEVEIRGVVRGLLRHY